MGVWMSGVRKMLIITSTALLLSACGAVGKGGGLFGPAPSPAEQKLASGVKSYEEGDYYVSLSAFQSALGMGLSKKDDQVLAYKYSAFIHCVSGRDKQCRDTFKKAIEIDPTFDLKPSEAGHPIWGPVFRSVKGQSVK